MNTKIPQPFDHIIYLIRGHRVMLDSELAVLYQVRTKELNQAVTRNLDRFPEDFMFQLTQAEAENLRFQSGTSSSGHGGRRYLPRAFTEQGVAMLSTVLSSRRAIHINIAIMRAFVRIRETLSLHKELAAKLQKIERDIYEHDAQITTIFGVLKSLRQGSPPPPRRMGFENPGGAMP